MRISASISTLLLRVYRAGCPGEENIHLMAMHERCVATLRNTATRILRMQDISQGSGQLPSEKFNL
jgi:hypothetical protein